MNVAEPLALNACPLLTVAPPLNVARLATSSVELKFAAPVTPSDPPSVVAPVPTEKVFAPVTAVFPFKLTLPVPVERVPVPVCAMLLLNVAMPVTPSVPPSVVAPVPTVKVFAPVTAVAPLSETDPVPVENVPAPDWVKLPAVFKLAFAFTSPVNAAAPVPRNE